VDAIKYIKITGGNIPSTLPRAPNLNPTTRIRVTVIPNKTETNEYRAVT
jgi:hypothetical protein